MEGVDYRIAYADGNQRVVATYQGEELVDTTEALTEIEAKQFLSTFVSPSVYNVSYVNNITVKEEGEYTIGLKIDGTTITLDVVIENGKLMEYSYTANVSTAKTQVTCEFADNDTNTEAESSAG